MGKNWNGKKTKNATWNRSTELVRDRKIKKTEEKEKSKPTPVLLSSELKDSYIQDRENTVAFFTIKWPKFTPSKPLKRTLKYKLYNVQNSAQPKLPHKLSFSL